MSHIFERLKNDILEKPFREILRIVCITALVYIPLHAIEEAALHWLNQQISDALSLNTFSITQLLFITWTYALLPITVIVLILTWRPTQLSVWFGTAGALSILLVAQYTHNETSELTTRLNTTEKQLRQDDQIITLMWQLQNLEKGRDAVWVLEQEREKLVTQYAEQACGSQDKRLANRLNYTKQQISNRESKINNISIEYFDKPLNLELHPNFDNNHYTPAANEHKIWNRFDQEEYRRLSDQYETSRRTITGLLKKFDDAIEQQESILDMLKRHGVM